MIKDFVIFTILFGLQFGGLYFVGQNEWMNLGEIPLAEKIILIFYLLFIVSHFSVVFIPKFTEVLMGQVFLAFNVLKFIFAGLIFFFIGSQKEGPLSNPFVLLFIGSYFLYLTLEVVLIAKRLKSQND